MSEIRISRMQKEPQQFPYHGSLRRNDVDAFLERSRDLVTDTFVDTIITMGSVRSSFMARVKETRIILWHRETVSEPAEGVE